MKCRKCESLFRSSNRCSSLILGNFLLCWYGIGFIVISALAIILEFAATATSL
jgi:hypothetical protein